MARTSRKSDQKRGQKKVARSPSRKTAKKTPASPRKKNASKVDRWLTEKGLERLKMLASISESYTELAERIRINKTTLIRWRQAYPEINKAVQDAETDKIDMARSAVIDAFKWRKVRHKTSKYMPKDKTVLQAERANYVATNFNQYKLDHPEATQSELQTERARISIEAAKTIKTREKVDYSLTEDDLPPDVNAALTYLKLRSEDFKDKGADELAQARIALARAQADLAKLSLRERQSLHDTRPIQIVLPKIPDEPVETDDSQDDEPSNDNADEREEKGD